MDLKSLLNTRIQSNPEVVLTDDPDYYVIRVKKTDPKLTGSGNSYALVRAQKWALVSLGELQLRLSLGLYLVPKDNTETNV